MADKLVDERPGILAWAVAGCLAWQREGLGEAQCITEATAEYRSESDLIGQWVDARCDTGERLSCEAGQLYQDYSNWCQKTGTEPESGTKFGTTLGQRGYRKSKSTTTGCILRHGLDLRTVSGEGH